MAGRDDIVKRSKRIKREKEKDPERLEDISDGLTHIMYDRRVFDGFAGALAVNDRNHCRRSKFSALAALRFGYLVRRSWTKAKIAGRFRCKDRIGAAGGCGGSNEAKPLETWCAERSVYSVLITDYF
jgi:hypothetical protein